MTLVLGGVVLPEVRNLDRVDQHRAELPQEVEHRLHLAVDLRVPAEELAHHAQARAGEAVGVESFRCSPRPCPAEAAVTGSSRSVPVIAESRIAASATVRHIGPAVSWVDEIGMMPRRETRPTVGLIPTRPHIEAGQRIEPSVSVPMPAAARLPEMPAPVPLDEPHGLRSRAYGFLTCPPRPLQPEVDRVERKFAHSERLVLPRTTAPAARRRSMRKASLAAIDPASANEPAVVCIRSPVSMLSLTITGMPCSGPRTLPALRSRSSASAISNACGLDFGDGVRTHPSRSRHGRRRRSVRGRALPTAASSNGRTRAPPERSRIASSSSSNGFAPAAGDALAAGDAATSADCASAASPSATLPSTAPPTVPSSSRRLSPLSCGSTCFTAFSLAGAVDFQVLADPLTTPDARARPGLP